MSSYQWNASDYEKNSSQQQLWARELLDKLSLRGDEQALDVGCGDGKVTAELAAALPDGFVLGVDNSPQMVALARQRYPLLEYPNLDFRLEDARRMPFAAEFSIVFSNAALHWIQEHMPALEGISKSLKPGGKALLQMGGRGNAIGIITATEKLIQAPEWSQYFMEFKFPYGFYGPEEYTNWLSMVGLTPTRVELIQKDMTQPGEAGLAGWIRTTWLPYTQQIPEGKRETFISALVKTYLETHHADSRGQVHVEMIRLEVEALKP